MKRDVLLSVLDQAIISAFSLVLNLAFIAYATPDEFGRFVLVLAGGFFAMSAQNALVIMPLNYLLPGRPSEEVQAQLSMLTSVNLGFVCVAVPVGLGLGLVVEAEGTVYLSIFAYLLTMLMREYARNAMIVRGNIVRALAHDTIAIVVSATAVPAFWTLLRPEAAALCGIATGNVAAFLLARMDLRFDLRRLPSHLAAYRNIWRETRWALQGALQNEVEARSYVFLVERWRDAASLGTLQAGRVAISPLQLVNTAWRRVARPRMVEALHHDRADAVARTLWSGALLVAGLSLVYGLFLLLAWPALETFVFRHRYEGMETIVLCWWFYAVIVGLAAIPATLLEARRQFRALAAVGFVVAGLILLLLFGLVFVDFDISSVVMILAGVHLLELGVYCAMLSRNSSGWRTKATEAGSKP